MNQQLNPEEEKVLNFLRTKEYNLSVAMTGGGIIFPAMILPMGGFSDRIYDIQIPYDNRALNVYLGEVVTKCYCKEVAEKMAQKALKNNPNSHYQSEKGRAIGVGITCSLMRHENEREGRVNGMYVCIASNIDKKEYHFDYTDEKQGRSYQEMLAGLTLFSLLLDYLGYSPN